MLGSTYFAQNYASIICQGLPIVSMAMDLQPYLMESPVLTAQSIGTCGFTPVIDRHVGDYYYYL